MRWRFIERIASLAPGESIAGTARSDFPDTLFADHFPGFAVTPGVLCVEIAAQLAGMLVQATVYQRQHSWVLPFLASIERARFSQMVPPRAALLASATLDQLRPDGALCQASLSCAGETALTVRLMYAFDLGLAQRVGAERLAQECRHTFERLESPWRPADA